MATDPPIITSSERRAFKRCPQRWWWEYREGLRPYEVNDKLWFGIGIHLALAHYYGKPGYKRQMDYVEVWESFCDDDEISKFIRQRPFDDAESQWVEARALGISMLTDYHVHYGGDPHWDVIATEKPFAIAIPDPRSPDDDIAEFDSTFDGVYRDKNDRMIKLMEHKTAATVSLGHLPMDDQGGSYWAVAQQILRADGILKPKQIIGGIEYNFLKKALPDPRPRDADGYCLNKDGSRSKQQPAPRFIRETVMRTANQRVTQIRRIQSEALNMERFRSGEQTLYKNPTRDCSWDCPFYNLCELDDMGQDAEEFKSAVFIVRDPYDRYRMLKSAAEV